MSPVDTQSTLAAQMRRRRPLQIVEPMLVKFKRAAAKLRADGVTQAEIDAMLDDFEKIYAHDDDAERKLVVAALRKAARPIQ